MIVAFVALASLFFRWQDDRDESLANKMIVQENVEQMSKILGRQRAKLGDDFTWYSNHCHRVYHYSMHFLDSEQKETYGNLIETAIAYHKIGLWSDQTLAYLKPSWKYAKGKLDKARMQLGSDDMRLISSIILANTKLTEYESQKGENYNAVVNAVRKAGWIDITGGLLHGGMPQEHIKTISSTFPYEGCQMMLMKFPLRLHSWDVLKIYSELSSVFKY